MEMVISNEFTELSQSEKLSVDGGGALEVVQAFVGTVLIGISPAVGVGNGTPVAGGYAAAGLIGFGMTLIGAASH